MRILILRASIAWIVVAASTLVVGASNEFGGSAGVNGDQADNSKRAAGAIYIFQP